MIRKLLRPALALEILIDGQSLATILVDDAVTDPLLFNLWDAGLGAYNLQLDWQQIALSKLASGQH